MNSFSENLDSFFGKKNLLEESMSVGPCLSQESNADNAPSFLLRATGQNLSTDGLRYCGKCNRKIARVLSSVERFPNTRGQRERVSNPGRLGVRYRKPW
jgi:hypothetical protein